MKVRNLKNLWLVGFCVMLAFLIIFGDEARSANEDHGKTLARAASEFGNFSTEKMMEPPDADSAEQALAELEEILDILERAEADTREQASLDKQDDLTPLFFTYNICALYDIAKKIKERFGEDSDWAGGFTEAMVEIFQKAEESGQIDAFLGSSLNDEAQKWNDWIYPSWYYHFAAGDSYIWVEYSSSNSRRLVGGKIRFNSGDEEVDFPVVWNVTPIDNPLTPYIRENEQTLYFSCGFSQTKLISIPLPLDLHLYIFAAHWFDNVEAVDTFDTFRFCEDWYCPAQGEPRCVNWCRNYFGMPEENPNQNEDWAQENDWGTSPLVQFIPFRGKWGHSLTGPEFFDNITLYADEEITISGYEVVLNGISIVRCITQGGQICRLQTFSSDSPLELAGRIESYRLNQLNLTPSQRTRLLEETAKNIGQAIGGRYGGEWPRWPESSPWIAYEPLPRAWCSEYACNMIEHYSDLDDWAGAGECDDISVHTMWNYYRSTDSNGDGCPDRISAARDPVWPPEPSRCLDEWGELGEKVWRGYYAGLRDPRDEENIHSTFFIEWIIEPIEVEGIPGDEDGECSAEFRAIGGNQGGAPGRVTVTGRPPSPNHVTICNDVDCDCDSYPLNQIPYRWTDSNDTTFFGKTWHPSKEE